MKNPIPPHATTRREFLGALGLTAAALGLGLAPADCKAAGSQSAPDPRKIPVGLQLYSLRTQCQTDLPGTLKSVSQIGYKGVEFAGYHGRGARELRKMLDDNGLVACGSHTPIDSLQKDKINETVEFNQVIGNKFLICPYMTGKSRQEWLDNAKFFNNLANQVEPQGLFVGYHAHAHDFEQLDGQSAWDIFFGNTQPSVIMQLDTSNCREGGADPLTVLKKYPGRARTIHIKAHSAGPEAVIPEGDIDWNAIFQFCEGPGKTEWYVVEHETSKDPLDTVKRTFAALQRLGKV